MRILALFGKMLISELPSEANNRAMLLHVRNGNPKYRCTITPVYNPKHETAYDCNVTRDWERNLTGHCDVGDRRMSSSNSITR